MKKLYLVRHGETELNLKKVYYGALDCDLTEKGVTQATSLTSLFEPLHLDRVYFSPLLRARRSAELLLGENPVPRVADDRLRELNFGAWEGKRYDELQDDPVYAQWCDDWQHTRPPGGESFADLACRSRAFYDNLMALEEDNVLVVAHHAVLQQLLCYLLEEEAERCWHFSFDQGTYTYFEFSGDFAVLRGHNLHPLSDI